MEGWSYLTGYPQLCEAETEVSGIRSTTISTAAGTTTTESGGILA